MPLHPEELRIAGSLHELVSRSEAISEVVEGSLGWRAGRLGDLIHAREGMSLRDLLELLRELNTTPNDFFSRLYGGGSSASGEAGGFAESKRVVLDALARRRSWKREREES